MAKVYGLQGYLTGKLGATVFAIRNGEQISRQYNPVVANPKTDAQVAVRAKMKLLSQLSAAVAPVVAMPRVGTVSPRNRFTSQNFEYTTYSNERASIPMADILLTASYTGFPGFSATRNSASGIITVLDESVAESWDKVVYVVLKKNDTGSINPACSLVVSEAGSDGLFRGVLPYVSGDISVHAYGLRLNTTESRVRFGNISAPSAEDVARLITSRTYNANDMSVSETRGLYLDSSQSSGETEGVSRVLISAIPYDRATNAANVGGSIAGAGRIELNGSYTLNATPDEDYTFLGWADSPTGAIISTSASLSGVATAGRTVYAIFRYNKVIITTSAFDITSNSTMSGVEITGAGNYNVGDSVTLVAPNVNGKQFLRWRTTNDENYATAQSITVVAGGNETFTAVYSDPVPVFAVNAAYANGSNAATGSISGSAQVTEGNSVTLVASPAANYQFVGWYNNGGATGTPVSTSANYTFTPSSDITLYAYFRLIGGSNED